MTLSFQARTWLMAVGVFLLSVQSPTWAALPEGMGFLAVLIACGLAGAEGGSQPIKARHITYICGGFLLYMLASFFWTVVPYDSLLIFKTYAIFPLVILCGLFAGGRLVDVRLFFKLVMFYGAALSVLAGMQVVANNGLSFNIANTVFDNANSLAVFLGICGLIAVNTLMNSSSKKLYAVCLAIILCGLFLTSARAAYALFVLTGMLLVIWQRNKAEDGGIRSLRLHLRGIAGAALLAVGTCIGLLMFLGSGGFPLESLLNMGTLSSRLTMWHGAITAALSTHPFIGNGIGAFKSVYMEFRPASDRTTGYHAHNDLFHLWVELGLVGLLLAGGIWVAVFCRILKVLSKQENGDSLTGLTIAILMFCLMMSMVTPVILLSSVLVILAVCVVSLFNWEQEECREGSHPRQFSQVWMIFLIMMGCLILQNTASEFTMYKVRGYLRQGETEQFVNGLALAESLALKLNPHVAIFQGAALFSLYDQGLLKDATQSQMLDEATYYFSRARHLNPYNPENDYYEGLVALREGDRPRARELFGQALRRDPTYVIARQNLVSLTSDADEAYAILKDGLRYYYWKSDPTPLFAQILEQAQNRNDQVTAAKAVEKLKNQLRLN